RKNQEPIKCCLPEVQVHARGKGLFKDRLCLRDTTQILAKIARCGAKCEGWWQSWQRHLNLLSAKELDVSQAFRKCGNVTHALIQSPATLQRLARQAANPRLHDYGPYSLECSLISRPH